MIRGSVLALLGLLAGTGVVSGVQQPRSTQPIAQTATVAQTPAPADGPTAYKQVVDKYCVSCHNDRLKTAELTLQNLDLTDVGGQTLALEKVVRKLRARAMPPIGRPRPEDAVYAEMTAWLEASLDRAAAAKPNPGRTAALHRLNRAEYRNSVRDLLALDVDVSALLPPDAASYGFDNIGDVLGVSPVLLERYIGVARRISRLAVGSPSITASTATYPIPSDLTQDDHLDGLPWGTRGGTLIRHHFPLDGEYVIKIRLARESVVDLISGLTEPHKIQVTLDGGEITVLTVGEGIDKGKTGNTVRPRDSLLGDALLRTADENLQVRFPATAGAHLVGVAFIKQSSAALETVRAPFQRAAPENGDSHGKPYLNNVTIGGPFNPTGPGDTPSRRRVFQCRPAAPKDEARCANQILSTLAHRAYRRPVTRTDIDDLMSFFREGRESGTFESGVELALTRLLVSPSFLFRVEHDPEGAAPGAPYRVPDLDLASRLSFFLWSSIPDDELLGLAERRQLSDPTVLEKQVKRMLADPRSEALVSNFAGQWLYLRNVSSLLPDRRLFPDFNENLRRAFKRESELFFDSIVREDRSVLDLLTAKYAFVNERLAKHYGIPNVYGDHFRRIELTDSPRGGILGQGSILTVRSYPNRTSPVLRGVWILENILGTPPPPPPPNVPDLKDTNNEGKVLSMRERMAQHRANPACGVCHSHMDPLGLPMENFDAIGQWRTKSESEGAVDASGSLPDGSTFEGVTGLRDVLIGHSREFVLTLTEKLMIYGLGRGVEFYDQPAIRRVANEAAKNDFRFSAIVMGIAKSAPFQMRRAAGSSETSAQTTSVP